MSTSHHGVESWTAFWSELVERLDAIDLGSRSASKFDELTTWVEGTWALEPGDVVCKYIQHPKNRWNRLREASRREPAAILLLFEGDDHGELHTRVQETACVCPSLRLVMALVRPAGEAWSLSALLLRDGTKLPALLTRPGTPVAPTVFTTQAQCTPGSPLPPASEAAGRRLAAAIKSLGTTGDDPASPHRALASQALVELTGQRLERIAIKTVPSTKNLGNRMGEALARLPGILVVVCPEMLGERVLEETERWTTSDPVPLVLVLCGEQTRVQVIGPDNDVVLRLRDALEEPAEEPPAPSDAESVRERPSDDATDWHAWSYEEWNDRLLDYCLRAAAPDPPPVERLAATPEELVVVVGGTQDDIDDVARAFVDACLTKIPSGRSFYGYCGSDLGRRRASEVPWTPEAEVPPYFFAMLWFTCLVAYGYPNKEAGFYERMWDLMGNTDHLRGLPELWWEVAEWTLRRSEAEDPIRILSLPPKDDFRTTIGESHFLAFPHKHDRRQIARVLVEADLVGFEPPITPVVAGLQADRAKFSTLFREDLDNFVARFVDGGRDPRDSAFWRAVRQEALQPSYIAGAGQLRRAATSILGVFDDEGFLPLLGCSADWTPPSEYTVNALDNAIGPFEHYVVAADGGIEAVFQVMFGSVGLLGPGPRALINQGVLVFQEDQSHEFFLVNGHDISGADLALVRDDLVDPFVAAFGGTSERSRVAGWSQIVGCTVKPLDEPPAGLESVVHLQRTMSPPTLRFVGGIQMPGGHLGIDGFLPRVKAPDADMVHVVLNGRRLDCGRTAETEWSLPAVLLESLPARCHVVGTWMYAHGDERTSERVLHLRRAAIDDDYRPLGAGHFFIEGCRPGQRPIVGGSPISLGMVTPHGEGSIDLIDYEPSVRFIGPGDGELSLEPKPGFDWLAVGHKNHPELVVFVGDPDRPEPPADRRSKAPGDRRHWRATFGKAGEIRVRAKDGSYQPLEAHPLVVEARGRMLKHRARFGAPACAETRLDTLQLEPPHRAAPLDATLSVADALAALSARRSGLRYRTVQQLFEELTNVREYALHHELIRAWTEAGALDLVRSQTYSSTRLVARRPRFVAVRRGPHVEASLLGLVTRARAAQVRRLAEEFGVVQQDIEPGCPWQPTTIRLRASETALKEIGGRAGLDPAEWLAWPRGSEVPDHLCVDVRAQELWTDSPPSGFSLAKVWDWAEAEFRRDVPSSDSGVQLEQRTQRDSCSIYVVLVDGSPRLWTHMRNWALLYAHDRAGRPPFVLNRSGWLTTTGHSPVHLPLSLGRICAVLGEGLAGPILDPRTGRVDGYCYPFGRRLTQLVAEVIPDGWLKEEVS